MRYSRAFIPTLKEAPKDAVTASHALLLRGGFVRMIGAGIYEFLPLGRRVLAKVERIVREEMDRAGAQEVLMPALLPSDYYRETGRWDTFGDILMRLKDRRGAEYNLGPTHEEIITDMVRRDVKSYRQLPLNLYQIQMKFRDEPRPRAGLLRCREFIMKDAYSFDIDEAGALRSYEQMRDAYHRIFKRLGLEYRVVQADSGAMGGSTSAEFQVLAQNGEDAIVACSACEYAANVEVAEAKAPTRPTMPAEKGLEKVHTPNAHTIEEIVAFFKGEITPQQTLKSIVLTGGVMAIVRGDRELNEIKVARHLGLSAVMLAGEAEVEERTGAAVGFAGPVGYKGRIVIDPTAAAVINGVAGANATDYHHKNVNFGRDFRAEVASIATVVEGDACTKCGAALKAYRGIEGGHIFVLGTHYSAKMNATYLNDKGEKCPIIMGCYGIGVSRLVAAAIEQHNDANGIVWPMAIAPYQVIITSIGTESEVGEQAERLYRELSDRGVEVLWDDRDERPGVKFKDADLLGIPVRVTIGARALKEQCVELKLRTEKDARKIPLAEAGVTLSRLST